MTHLLLHFRRMAGKYLAVDRHARTFEILWPFIEKAVDIVLIDKCDLQRNRVEHCGKLRNGQVPARHDDFSIPYMFTAIFCMQILLCRLPCRIFHTKADRIIFRIAVNSKPLFLREIQGTVREENIGFLVDHILHALQHNAKTFQPVIFRLLNRQLLCQRCQFIPDLIIGCPHHIRRAADPVFYFQMRIQKIPFLCIMDRNFPQLSKQLR